MRQRSHPAILYLCCQPLRGGSCGSRGLRSGGCRGGRCRSRLGGRGCRGGRCRSRRGSRGCRGGSRRGLLDSCRRRRRHMCARLPPELSDHQHDDGDDDPNPSSLALHVNPPGCVLHQQTQSYIESTRFTKRKRWVTFRWLMKSTALRLMPSPSRRSSATIQRISTRGAAKFTMQCASPPPSPAEQRRSAVLVSQFRY